MQQLVKIQRGSKFGAREVYAENGFEGPMRQHGPTVLLGVTRDRGSPRIFRQCEVRCPTYGEKLKSGPKLQPQSGHEPELGDIVYGMPR